MSDPLAVSKEYSLWLQIDGELLEKKPLGRKSHFSSFVLARRAEKHKYEWILNSRLA